MWLICIGNGLFQKKVQVGQMGWGRVDWRHTFLKKTVEYLGLSLYPRKFQTKWSFTPRKIHKIVLHSLELPRPKIKTHPWKFQFFFNWPLKFSHYIFSIYPEEIPCPQPSHLFGTFSGNSSIASAILKLSYKIVIWLFWMKLTCPLGIPEKSKQVGLRM